MSKMIGSALRDVGHDDGGRLSEQVRRHPYSVVLLISSESAHRDVFNILLQVPDDGHTRFPGKKARFPQYGNHMTPMPEHRQSLTEDVLIRDQRRQRCRTTSV